jgi:hypothetical protein
VSDDAHRIRRQGRLTLNGTLADAVPLFTAEGERRWVEGWDPWFPLRDHVHERGEVWTTTAGSRTTIWVTVERRVDGALFARVTAGVTAGLVEVSCGPGLDGTTDVDVTYDLTALSEEGRDAIAHLRDGFGEMLATWQSLAQATLDGAGGPPYA